MPGTSSHFRAAVIHVTQQQRGEHWTFLTIWHIPALLKANQSESCLLPNENLCNLCTVFVCMFYSSTGTVSDCKLPNGADLPFGKAQVPSWGPGRSYCVVCGIIFCNIYIFARISKAIQDCCFEMIFDHYLWAGLFHQYSWGIMRFQNLLGYMNAFLLFLGEIWRQMEVLRFFFLSSKMLDNLFL